MRVIKNGRHAVEDAVRIRHDMDIAPSAVLVNGVDKKVRTSYEYGGYAKKGYGYVGHYHQKYSANPGDDSIGRQLVHHDSSQARPPASARAQGATRPSAARDSLVSAGGAGKTDRFKA